MLQNTVKRNAERGNPRLSVSNQRDVNILNGNRFMISSQTGDVVDQGHGVFRDDTRFLSRFELQINGKTPCTLAADNTTPYSAAFYLTNADLAHGLVPKHSLAIERKRFIEEDVREEFFLANVSEKESTCRLSFKVDADYADLFLVKSRVFYGPGRYANYSRNPLRISRKFLTKRDNAFQFTCFDPKTKFRAETLVWFSKKGTVERNSIFYDVSLKPKERFHLTTVIVLLVGGEKRKSKYTDRYFLHEEKKIHDALKKWNITVPKLDTSWDDLKHAYRASLVDLVSLRMYDPTGTQGWELPAAGCPWFMTLFGRDTIITSYQSMLFGGSLARGAIKALANYQAQRADKLKDAEPGKILHELRFGDYAAESKRYPYYGSIDSTPLFLILVSEVFRWSGDHSFASKYRQNILNALRWIDEFGDLDKDDFLEYKKKSKEGLVNQSWKDSWNSMMFSNGKIAKPPIATCEVQGYVYDAKRRIAEIAREVWREKSLAKKLEDEARDLKKLFNERFWIEDKGCYALALDGEKRLVDSMTSNNGQLFWCGIVDKNRAKSVVRRLMGEDMFSGYGIRTMSRKDAGYNPISYHNGCVWAHDNSLIACGLADYGFQGESDKITDALLEASRSFSYTMPEAFSGFPKLRTGFPVGYPTACSPQAWAAGACLLLLRTLLGISPSREKKNIEIKNPLLHHKELNIELSGVEAFGKRFDISVRDGSKPEIRESRENRQVVS